MYRALCCTCSMRNSFPHSHSPPTHLPPPELVYNLITGVDGGIYPNLSLHDVGCSVCFILLNSKNAAYHAPHHSYLIHPNSLY